MAVAVPERLDEAELARQADALERRAEQLRQEARDLSRQAIDLRLEAERADREPVAIIQQRIGVERDARLLARIGDTLEQIGPCSSTILAEHIGVSQQRVQKALRVLEQTKTVKRSGIRRGTVWGLADDEDLNGHGARASAYTLVLGAGRKLDTFDLQALDAELPMLSQGAIGAACRKLVAEGKFDEARDGRRKIYAFVRPEGKTVNRPKRELPEAKVIELARKSPLPRRGVAVAGTRRVRSGSPIVDELLRELADWPIVEVVKRKHKFSFKIDGKEVASCSTTPGASSLAGTRAELRRAGIAV